MDVKQLEAAVEAILFVMGEAVEPSRIAVATEQDEDVVRRVLGAMMARYDEEGRGVQIIELDGAFQMCTKASMYEYLVRVAHVPKKHVLTEVLLETLSIIAYKQPMVKCDHAVNKLVEYNLVVEAGRLDVPGRPILFKTTEEFLRYFGIQSLEDLPVLSPERVEDFKLEAEEEARTMELDKT